MVGLYIIMMSSSSFPLIDHNDHAFINSSICIAVDLIELKGSIVYSMCVCVCVCLSVHVCLFYFTVSCILLCSVSLVVNNIKKYPEKWIDLVNVEFTLAHRKRH